MSRFRIERDSLGEIRVPAEAYWGAQTQRAVENFPVSGRTLPPELIRALGLLKQAAAEQNGANGEVEPRLAEAIAEAAAEVAGGALADQFPVDVYQTGSGTSTNMNANEVIANRAIEILGGVRGSRDPVHPNDHVNRGQSSNDVFPSAIHLALLAGIRDSLLPALERLEGALAGKAAAFDHVVKLGRTHLQDATPIRLGQVFHGFAGQIRRSVSRLRGLTPVLAELPLGGTAVGTGLNAPAGFAAGVIARVAERTGLPLREAPNHFEAAGSRDSLVEAGGALRLSAVSLTKIANDLRWMASGPRGGLGEIRLPVLQPGSSIMPGKVNPVIPEAVLMVCARVAGNDATVALAGASGSFELNVMMPVMADVLLESCRLLSSAAEILRDRCIEGLEADEDRCLELVERSLGLATALVPEIGYDAAAEIAREAHRSGRSVREVARERAVLPDDRLERVLDPMRQTGPGSGPEREGGT